MITKETAQKIAEICNQIEECKQALAILKDKKKCEEPSLSVRQYEIDDGIYISVSRTMAANIIGQVLENLNKEYSSLNDKALKEGK